MPKLQASKVDPNAVPVPFTLPNPHQRALLYARNIFGQLRRQSRESRALMGWFCDNSLAFGVEVDEDSDNYYLRRRGREVPTSNGWEILAQTLNATNAPAEINNHNLLVSIGDKLNFSLHEVNILQLCVEYFTNKLVEDLWDCISGARGHGPRLVADAGIFSLLTGISQDEVARILRNNAPLYASGLIINDRNGVIQLLNRLTRSLREEGKTACDPLETLFSKPVAHSLEMKEFAHLGQDVHRIKALLEGALARGEKGVHILLYGEPGTGKTELAKTLAASLGTPLRMVGEADQDGDEPNRQERQSELRLAQRLLHYAGPTLILFDEAEDLFAVHGRDIFGTSVTPSRAYLHRLLEETSLPVIWTANDISEFGPAVLRRMSCCLEVRVPPPHTRATLWAKAAEEAGVKVPTEEFGRLANMLPAAPALARSAMRVASMAGGDLDTVQWALSGVMRAMNNGTLPLGSTGNDQFDPALLTTNVDLGAMADRLAKKGAPRNISLLLSGPPGSGKSAYARYLANRMGLPILFRRASDLFDKFVGETEKRIAAAFSEATATGSFLIFDEADSLIADRRGAERNYEVSQTNEMLTWMERHSLPFCCTTNFADRLDKAAMRRFLIKAEFGYLKPEQSARAFRQTFQLDPPPGLTMLDRLTPADFDLVKRSALLQDTLNDPRALFEALKQEQRAKGEHTNPIGFLKSA